MNREQKRNFVKNAKKNGMSRSNAEKFAEIMDTKGNRYTPAQEIHTGDKVMLKVAELKAKKNFVIMNPAYRTFVENSEGVVYTAVCERAELIHLEEQPRWLFWCGDMDVVEPKTVEEGTGEDVETVNDLS